MVRFCERSLRFKKSPSGDFFHFNFYTFIKNLFTLFVKSEGTIVFKLRVPNAKTIAAIDELEAPKSRSKVKRYNTLEDMHAALKRK